MEKDDSPAFETVCHVDEIPEGERRTFVVAEAMIGVFHVGGRLFALAKECPHEGASLAHGIVERDTVRCRIHHWRFSIRDGTYLDEDKPQCNARTCPVAPWKAVPLVPVVATSCSCPADGGMS